MLQRVFLVGIVITTFAFSFGDALAKQNRQQIIQLQRMIAQQNERIDGLTSLIEGLSSSLAQMKMVQKHSQNEQEDNRTRKLIDELGKMIDEINRNYVRKDELAAMLSASGVRKSSKRSQTYSQNKGDSHTRTDTKPPAKLYSEGVRQFVKKRYDEARKHFLITAQKGYKPAASNYYLGEIAYYTKRYQDAIFYYKKSAGLYDGASYIDVLMLHTAISLEKTGEKNQAEIFYRNVIENYPGKKAASIAKKRLGKL